MVCSLTRALLPGLMNVTFGDYTYHVLGIVETVKGILAFVVRPWGLQTIHWNEWIQSSQRMQYNRRKRINIIEGTVLLYILASVLRPPCPMSQLPIAPYPHHWPVCVADPSLCASLSVRVGVSVVRPPVGCGGSSYGPAADGAGDHHASDRTGTDREYVGLRRRTGEGTSTRGGEEAGDAEGRKPCRVECGCH